MAEAPTIEAALKQFEEALGKLDAAVSRRLSADQDLAALTEQFSRLEEDRSRLAQDLDAEAARSGRLEDANKDVSHRLVVAMESIRSVLDAHNG
jgi:chromosome segregation ATPase